MSTILHIIGWWILLSWTVGPCLTWFIFRSKRKARAERERWMALHPAMIGHFKTSSAATSDESRRAVADPTPALGSKTHPWTPPAALAGPSIASGASAPAV